MTTSIQRTHICAALVFTLAGFGATRALAARADKETPEPAAKLAPKSVPVKATATAPEKTGPAKVAPAATSKSAPAVAPAKPAIAPPTPAGRSAQATPAASTAPAPATKATNLPPRTRQPDPAEPRIVKRRRAAAETSPQVSATTGAPIPAAISDELAKMRQEIARLKAYDEQVVGPAPSAAPTGPTAEEKQRRAELTQRRTALMEKRSKLEAAVASGAVERDALTPSFEVLRSQLAAIDTQEAQVAEKPIVAEARPPLLQRITTLETELAQAKVRNAELESKLQAPPPEPAAPVAPPIPPASPLKWEGLVDSHGVWNLAHPQSTASQPYRTFDTRPNSFTLSYAKLGTQLDAGPVTLRIDLGYGHTGAIINQASAAGSAGSTTDTLGASLYGSALLVQQAYAQLRLGEKLVLDAGKFATSAGAEVLDTNKNWLYSRSLLFFGQPAVHTGLRLGYQVLPALSVQASVVNGFNNDPAPVKDKTFGLSVSYTPSPATSAVATTYVGKFAQYDRSAPPPDDVQVLVDLVLAHAPSNALAFNVNLDFYAIGASRWYGASAMGRYVALPSLVLAARAELLRSEGGYSAALGGDGYLGEVTLMAAAPFAEHYELRVEFRADLASENVFRPVVGQDSSKQVTGLLGFLAWF